MDQDKTGRRLKFYGLNDYGTFFELKKVITFLDNYSESKMNYTLDEVIELYNVSQFVEHGVFPKDCDEKKHILNFSEKSLFILKNGRISG